MSFKHWQYGFPGAILVFWGSGPVKKTELTIAHTQSVREYMGILTLPETNIAPEHIPSQKNQYSYHPCSGAVSPETLASSEFEQFG